VKEKPTVRSPFLVEFPSDRIPKTTKDVTVYFFNQSSSFRDELVMRKAVAAQNASKIYQRIPGSMCNITLWPVSVVTVVVGKAMCIPYHECVSVFLPYYPARKSHLFRAIL